MITLTRIDGRNIVVNADEIETVEAFHDTTLCLKSGRRIIVCENPETIIDKVVKYRQTINESNSEIRVDYDGKQ